MTPLEALEKLSNVAFTNTTEEKHSIIQNVELVHIIKKFIEDNEDTKDHHNSMGIQLMRYHGIEEALLEAYETGEPETVMEVVERLIVDD